LQQYLKSITGLDFPLKKTEKRQATIWIGTDTAIGAQTIHYGFKKGDLHISGGSTKSTLYAVYDFLEKELDCRFYTPTVEVIPTQERITLAKTLNYTYTPPIKIRTVHSRLFYENHQFSDQQKVTYEAFPTYVPDARVHTFHRFLPADKFLNQHPEYYALRNGKRIPTQLCLTNETVYNIVKDSVAAQLARYPDAEVISVSQDDNGQYCQCDACEAIHEREASPAGSMIYFVNRIAKEFPQKQISTLAYQYTRKAPKTIKPEPNVLITLCSIECDRSAPIAEKCQDFKADLVAWGAITDNVRIWDYTTQFTNFLAPFPNLRTLKPNIELFRDNNATWIFEQHSNNPSELFELRSYLTAQLLWNPDQAVDVIMIDFLEGYYEAAAPMIYAYINEIHEAIQQDSTFFLFLYGDPAQGFDSFLSEEKLTHYDSLYQIANEQVSTNPELLNRVNAARLSVDYAWLEFAKTNLNAMLKKGGEQAIKERLARFTKTTTENNITAMNEMRYSVEEYIETYQRTLERAKGANLAFQKPVQLLTSPKKYAKEDPQALTDGALGGNSFYANWLGFEGEHLSAIIDLEEVQEVSEISTAFLQVTNHIVFFPKRVTFSISTDGKKFRKVKRINNEFPLAKTSKINDIQYFNYTGKPRKARYIKIEGQSDLTAPIWHHGAGLPSWIFVDEVMVR
ncbi:MAG: DUF4838 domain-containing protein, partial [Saprospiraceae bacterium]